MCLVYGKIIWNFTRVWMLFNEQEVWGKVGMKFREKLTIFSHGDVIYPRPNGKKGTGSPPWLFEISFVPSSGFPLHYKEKWWFPPICFWIFSCWIFCLWWWLLIFFFLEWSRLAAIRDVMLLHFQIASSILFLLDLDRCRSGKFPWLNFKFQENFPVTNSRFPGKETFFPGAKTGKLSWIPLNVALRQRSKSTWIRSTIRRRRAKLPKIWNPTRDCYVGHTTSSKMI